MNNIELTITESPTSVDFEFVQAKIKPEQIKSVTPTYEVQRVLPDAGMTLGEVIVNPIPDPTAELEITENGEYNVARIGIVHTNVPIPADIKEYSRGGSYWDKTTKIYVFEPDLDITSLPNAVFQNCSLLERIINFPARLQSIPNIAFQNCKVLNDIQLPQSITSIGTQAFQGCSGLSALSLPDSITTIGIRAFNGCTNLRLSRLPQALTSIGNNAFAGCRELAIDSIPNGVSVITASAFAYCQQITQLTFFGNITEIQAQAFQFTNNCHLFDFTRNMAVPVLLNTNAFDTHNKTIRVLQSLLNEWQNATVWRDLVNVVWEGV